MNPEKMDAMLRESDPGIVSGESNPDDRILLESQQRWSDLSKRRVVRRTRLSLCIAAAGLFAMVGGIAAWIGPDLRDQRASVAVTVPAEKQDPGAPRTTIAVDGNRQSAGENDSIEAIRVTSEESAGSDRRKPAIRRSDRNRPRRRIGVESQIATEQLAEFAEFIDLAGPTDGETWKQSCGQLANQAGETQRAAIALVSKIDDAELRTRAFHLVCEAAGDSRSAVLTHWLSEPALRTMAWNHLADRATLTQSIRLIELASNDVERLQLCRVIAASPDPESVGVLLRLATDQAWRMSVGRSTDRLNPAHIRSLIMLMRDSSIPARTAAAFVLASVPGDQVDRVVTSMILGGRYRQPAYLVLLSRDTPQARSFLAQAASRPELTPALISARMHFANMEERLQQWIAESKGANDERSDTTLRLSPNDFGGNRSASLCDAEREIG